MHGGDKVDGSRGRAARGGIRAGREGKSIFAGLCDHVGQNES